MERARAMSCLARAEEMSYAVRAIAVKSMIGEGDATDD